VSRLSDYLHDAPWYARKATVPLRNAACRATHPIRSARGSYRNYRNRRFLETGKGFWVERHTRRLRSSLPVYRDRINPATGRARRDDAEIGRRADAAAARLRERGFPPRRAIPARDYAPAYKRNLPERSDPRARADAVLGPGTAERARKALAAERHNPWADPQRRTR
jgi:hypothetical protein